MNIANLFDTFSKKVTRVTGSYWAFIVACMLVIVWGVSGPMFHYSEDWQLVINTGTTIITFLMVFVIQQSSNKDTKAIHMKLDELIKVNKDADNRLRQLEEKSQQEIEEISKGISSE